MGTLHKLKPEDRGLIVSLPYRVGMWMSGMEDEAGERDDREEQKVIENVISSFSRKIEKYPFISAVMRETIEHRDQWSLWAARSDTVLPDCEQAVKLLRSRINNEALKNYKRILVKIASEVAGAYGEFGEFESENEKNFFRRLIPRLGPKRDAFMNILPAENDALQSLVNVLRDKKGAGGT